MFGCLDVWMFGCFYFWIFGFLDFGLSLLLGCLYCCHYSIPVQALWHPFTFAVWPLVAGSAYKIWRSVSFCFAAGLNDEWRAFSTLLIKQSAQHSLRDCPHVLVLVPERELCYPEWTLHFTRGSLRVDSSLALYWTQALLLS